MRRNRTQSSAVSPPAAIRAHLTSGGVRCVLGAGNDRFVWTPGDGSDTVEGQAGTDTLQFGGANVNENIYKRHICPLFLGQ